MSFNTRSILVAVANLFAIFVVVGFVSQGFLGGSADNKNVKPVLVQANDAEPVVEAAIPTVKQRDARHKGSSKGSSSEEEGVDCVPLYPTPSPTKGKGKGSSRRNLKSSKKSKGSKGSTPAPTVSTAPSFFCSDAPSLSPSVSVAPSVSAAPSCGKGKGSSSSSSSKGSCKGKGSSSSKGKGSRL